MDQTSKFTLSKEDAVLVIVDVQERLAQAMAKRQMVIDNCLHLIALFQLLDLPVIVTEQYPQGLGPTAPELREALPGYEPIEKLAFNCCDAPSFTLKLHGLGRKKILLAGMETHICVLQTSLGLMQSGYAVHVVDDAVCSRSRHNWKTGIAFMRDSGAVISCTETAMFQLLGAAGTEEFKIMSKRIK